MLYFFLFSDKLSKIVSNSSPVATGVQYINSTILHCSLNLQILLISKVFSFNYSGDLKFFLNNIKLSCSFFCFMHFFLESVLNHLLGFFSRFWEYLRTISIAALSPLELVENISTGRNLVFTSQNYELVAALNEKLGWISWISDFICLIFFILSLYC